MPIESRHEFGSLLNSLGLLGEAVEVGTLYGEFAGILLAAWRGKRLWCIDPYAVGYDVGDPGSPVDMKQALKTAEAKLRPYISAGRCTILLQSSPEAAARFAGCSITIFDPSSKSFKVGLYRPVSPSWTT